MTFDIKADPFYSEMYDKGINLKNLKDAGYGEPFHLTEETPREGIPSYKLTQRLLSAPKNKEIVVLYHTGSYNPFHEGHLSSIIEAKKFLESQGKHVALCYISPDCQEYANSKAVFMNIKQRHESILNHIYLYDEWIDVDIHPSVNFSRPTNFTTNIISLKNFLDNIIAVEYSLYYIYGEDNYGFNKIFETSYAKSRNIKGLCVTRTQSKSKTETNVHHENTDSSTKIRKTSLKPENNDGNIYYIRNDMSLAAPWLTTKQKQNHLNKIYNLIENNVTKNDIKIVTIKAEENINTALYKTPTISLDKHFKGTYNICASRLYDKYSIQAKPIKLIASPESQYSLEEQISLIPAGTYTLVDDDTASGYTLKNLIKLLPDHIKIDYIQLLTSYNYPQNQIYDVLDVRDFIPQAKYAGLVTIDNKNKIERTLYTDQGVNLITRAKFY